MPSPGAQCSRELPWVRPLATYRRARAVRFSGSRVFGVCILRHCTALRLSVMWPLTLNGVSTRIVPISNHSVYHSSTSAPRYCIIIMYVSFPSERIASLTRVSLVLSMLHAYRRCVLMRSEQAPGRERAEYKRHTHLYTQSTVCLSTAPHVLRYCVCAWSARLGTQSDKLFYCFAPDTHDTLERTYAKDTPIPVAWRSGVNLCVSTSHPALWRTYKFTKKSHANECTQHAGGRENTYTTNETVVLQLSGMRSRARLRMRGKMHHDDDW